MNERSTDILKSIKMPKHGHVPFSIAFAPTDIERMVEPIRANIEPLTNSSETMRRIFDGPPYSQGLPLKRNKPLPVFDVPCESHTLILLLRAAYEKEPYYDKYTSPKKMIKHIAPFFEDVFRGLTYFQMNQEYRDELELWICDEGPLNTCFEWTLHAKETTLARCALVTAQCLKLLPMLLKENFMTAAWMTVHHLLMVAPPTGESLNIVTSLGHYFHQMPSAMVDKILRLREISRSTPFCATPPQGVRILKAQWLVTRAGHTIVPVTPTDSLDVSLQDNGKHTVLTFKVNGKKAYFFGRACFDVCSTRFNKISAVLHRVITYDEQSPEWQDEIYPGGMIQRADFDGYVLFVE